jgi:hypothetical protein
MGKTNMQTTQNPMPIDSINGGGGGTAAPVMKLLYRRRKTKRRTRTFSRPLPLRRKEPLSRAIRASHTGKTHGGGFGKITSPSPPLG